MSNQPMTVTAENLRALSEQRRGRCIFRADLTSGTGVVLRYRIVGRAYDQTVSVSNAGIVTLIISTALRVPRENYGELLAYLSTQDSSWALFDVDPDGAVRTIVRQKLDDAPVSGPMLAEMEDAALRLLVRHIVNLECIARGELPREAPDVRLNRCAAEMLEHPRAELGRPMTLVEKVKDMIS